MTRAYWSAARLALALALVPLVLVPPASGAAVSPPPLLRIPLENFDQMQFFGLVRVGTPPQRFQVIFDTGSSDVWLPATGCGVCAGERRYDARASASHEPLAEPFHLEYGSGNASGAVMRERLLLGDDPPALELAGVRMGSVTATTQRLQRFQADGIVGLGLETLALITKPGLFRSAAAVVAQGERRGRQDDARLLGRFSMYINPLPGALPASQLIFGGVDEALPLAALSGVSTSSGSSSSSHAGNASVTWHRFLVVPYPSGSKALGFWAIRLAQFTVGETVSSTGSTATGSTLRRSSPAPTTSQTLASEQLGDVGDEPDSQEEDAAAVVTITHDAIAIVDSGTSLLLLPRDMFDRVMRVVARHLASRHGVQLAPHPRTVSGVACWYCAPEQFPPLTFAFASQALGPSQRLTLRGEDYVRCDDSVCSPQLDVHALFPSAPTRDADGAEDVVILGVMFMRAYYTLFDVERRSVSFACVVDAAKGGACRGGQHPPMLFHSDFLGDRVRWRYGWLLWSRMYLSLGMALLALAALLLWMALSTTASDVEKALAWVYGASQAGSSSSKGVASRAVRAVSVDSGLAASREPLTASPPSRSSSRVDTDSQDGDTCGLNVVWVDGYSASKPARRKSVSFDV